MELDPDEVFRDDGDDPENEAYQEREATKDLVVYLVDASPRMFSSTCKNEDQEEVTHFHVAVSCISQALKTQIINRSSDEVAICFFNTREKRNLQDLPGVYVLKFTGSEYLDLPTAKLIKEFDQIEEMFMKDIGSQHCIVSGSRENSIYNALWVAQALLRKRSVKSVDKRILLFTNEDDPFGRLKGAIKLDMTRTTLQRAKDAQDLGISIELLPLSRSDEKFNVSLFYADLLGLEGDAITQFLPSAEDRLEDMNLQLRKRIFKKRIVRRLTFAITDGLSIQLNTYALIRPTVTGAITWLDSVTNLPLKIERTFICADTGALVKDPPKRVQHYKNELVKFSMEELSKIKQVSSGYLRLLGFKPLSCLQEYHNLKPSTFLFPSDEEVVGSTHIFVALHRSMIRLERFALAFHGSSTNPRLVALIPQEEIVVAGGQIEPPGMHMIFLPYTDDIRAVEELHLDVNSAAPHATPEQIGKARSLMKRVDLTNFSVCQFSNPGRELSKHLRILSFPFMGRITMNVMSQTKVMHPRKGKLSLKMQPRKVQTTIG
uniref:Ku domain-containing protein n=1 Tax=Kalanchoe fedtschenkoi TaxID=63787 RepID=A0A7N0US95_KALFE